MAWFCSSFSSLYADNYALWLLLCLVGARRGKKKFVLIVFISHSGWRKINSALVNCQEILYSRSQKNIFQLPLQPLLKTLKLPVMHFLMGFYVLFMLGVWFKSLCFEVDVDVFIVCRGLFTSEILLSLLEKIFPSFAVIYCYKTFIWSLKIHFPGKNIGEHLKYFALKSLQHKILYFHLRYSFMIQTFSQNKC